MAIARLKLANPLPLVSLQNNPYQIAFMNARRIRVCVNGHQWRFAYTGKPPDLNCPVCGQLSQRGFRRFLLRAGRRGGKTRICALAMIEELTIPMVHWWACAPTYPTLNDYVLPAFFKQLPQQWLDDPRTDWSESELTLILPNKSISQFRSLDDPERGRGPGLNGLWLDEISLMQLLTWETIRPTLTENRGILIAGTTPKGEDWVHEHLYETAAAGKPGFWATHYTTLDNPIIDPEEIEEARQSMTDLMFRQEYMADIVTFTGAIYGDILPPAIIEGTDEQMRHYFPEWPSLDTTRNSITGTDPGTDHPFAGVHLVASPRGLVVTGEYEERNKPFLLHYSGIQAIRRGFNSRVATDRSQPQAQIELAQYGLFTTPAENDVVAGINRVSAWILASRQQINGLPSGLVITKRHSPNLIKRLQAYRWAENRHKDGSTGPRELVYKKNDDLPDALRYGLMLYPELPKGDPLSIGNKPRDLAGMPDNVRLEIERVRRIDAAAAKQHQEDKANDDSYGPDYAEGGDAAMGDFNY